MLKNNSKAIYTSWKLVVMWQRGHISDCLYRAEVLEVKKALEEWRSDPRFGVVVSYS